MEFGIFSQMHCPPWDDEHSRFMRELEISELCDAVGFKYDWSPEHHFLQYYSHQPAPEVYLSWVAARTKQIHIGTAITNITAAVNHPARVAERIATMDHLSEGRIEFGTGRGSSSAEWAGFAIPSAAETKPMWRESLEQIPRMWCDEPYSFEGQYFRMPERTVLPKPYSKPHPPMWVACSSPPTFIEAGELGLGALCFTFGTPAEIAEHVRNYKAAIKRCTNPVGAYINDNIAATTNMFSFDDAAAAAHLLEGRRWGASPAPLPSGPAAPPARRAPPPPGPPPPLPDPAPADLKAGLAVGGRQIGSPDEIAKVIDMYVELGVDQLIYAPLTLTLDQKNVRRSFDTFVQHVLTRLDVNPWQATTRQPQPPQRCT